MAGSASRESRSIVRCWGSVSAIRRVNARITRVETAPGRRMARGAASVFGFGVRGDEQRSLIREVPIRGRPGDPPPPPLLDGRRLAVRRRVPCSGDESLACALFLAGAADELVRD